MHLGSCANKASKAALVLDPPSALVSAADDVEVAAIAPSAVHTQRQQLCMALACMCFAACASLHVQ